MSLNESIVEDAALAMPGATLIPAFSQRKKEEYVEAIRWLNPAIPEEAAATDKESLSVQNPSKGG